MSGLLYDFPCSWSNTIWYRRSYSSYGRLETLVAEHLDHFHYLNDILQLAVPDLNDMLTKQLMDSLFIPLYVYSLTGAADNQVRS